MDLDGFGWWKYQLEHHTNMNTRDEYLINKTMDVQIHNEVLI